MKKILPIAGVLAVALIAMFFIVNNDDKREQTEQKTDEQSEDEYKYPPKKAEDLLSEQKQLESDIAAESKGSTLDDPYVNLDPYDRSPLAALVIFNTDKPAKVSFTVKGKDSETDISKTYDEAKTHHELPVLGLYPDKANTVMIKAKTKSGSTMNKSLTIKTDELPDYIPDIDIKTAKKEKMSLHDNELTFAIPSTKFVYGFDINGDVRWYGSGYNSHVLQPLDNGHLLYLGKDDNSGSAYNRLFETDYMGQLYNAFKISEQVAESESEGMESTLIHHDVAELPSGNLILTVNDDDGNYVEDTMIEMDRDTGEVVKQIDLKHLFPKEQYEDYDSTDPKDGKTDWFHQNSVVYDESDDSIIISGRNSDTVMKIDYQTKDIKWVLAHPQNWQKDTEQYLVEGQGDDFKYPGGQHDATILPDFDNNPDTIDLLIYDNNVVVTRGNDALSEEYSAGTHYRINEQTKQAEKIWSYGQERGEDFFTNIIGSARYMEDKDNVLIDFGHVDEGNQSNIVEVKHDNTSEVVFEAEITDFPKGAWVYRGARRALYTNTWDDTFSINE